MSLCNMMEAFRGVLTILEPIKHEDSKKSRQYFFGDIKISTFEWATSKPWKFFIILISLFLTFLLRMTLILVNSINEVPLKIISSTYNNKNVNTYNNKNVNSPSYFRIKIRII